MKKANAQTYRGFVLGRSADNDLFGTSLQMARRLFRAGEHSGALHDGPHASRAPRNLGWVLFREDGDALSVDDELTVLGLHGSLERSVHGILKFRLDVVVKKVEKRFLFRYLGEHPGHLFDGHEGLVDGRDADFGLVKRGASHQAADAAFFGRKDKK